MKNYWRKTGLVSADSASTLKRNCINCRRRVDGIIFNLNKKSNKPAWQM